MRTPEQIAIDISNGKDRASIKELEKMFGCRFCEMTVTQRRLGVAALSAKEEMLNSQVKREVE